MLVDPGNQRRTEYAEELVKNLEFVKNKDLLISNIFDPRYIMLDAKCTDRVILECILISHSLKENR